MHLGKRGTKADMPKLTYLYTYRTTRLCIQLDVCRYKFHYHSHAVQRKAALYLLQWFKGTLKEITFVDKHARSTLFKHIMRPLLEFWRGLFLVIAELPCKTVTTLSPATRLPPS